MLVSIKFEGYEPVEVLESTTSADQMESRRVGRSVTAVRMRSAIMTIDVGEVEARSGSASRCLQALFAPFLLRLLLDCCRCGRSACRRTARGRLRG